MNYFFKKRILYVTHSKHFMIRQKEVHTNIFIICPGAELLEPCPLPLKNSST